jgi:hypothetical protein
MGILKCCTLTGADDSINPKYLFELSKEYPFVEWGILLSRPRHGTGRYPCKEWIEEFSSQRWETVCDGKYYVKAAYHLCGDYAYEIAELGGQLDKFLITQADIGVIDRIQINMNTSRRPVDAGKFPSSSHWLFKDVVPILQWNMSNREYNLKIIERNYAPNIHFLHDASGGRGLTAEWKPPISGYFTGYAGGLGPENVLENIKKIDNIIGTGQYWIDMESKIRNEKDRFDLEKCAKVLSIVKNWQTENKIIFE